MANKIEFEDIVSKAVGTTYERVQTLGIYCWQYEKDEKRAAYFLPRFSFNQNKEYLENFYKDISKDNLQGKGIFSSIWRIAKFYNKVPVYEPEKVLYSDLQTLSAFNAWVQADENLRTKRDNKDDNTFLQVYVLENESRFAEYKYTEGQNSPGASAYYDWSDILEKREIAKK